MLERHKDNYGRMPRQISADGGFASKDNLAYAKGNGVKDAVFAKKRGLSVLDMAQSATRYSATSGPASKLEYPSSSAPSVLTAAPGRAGRDSAGTS
jgi:hypothetical protein